jgi:hypothetical protein
VDAQELTMNVEILRFNLSEAREAIGNVLDRLAPDALSEEQLDEEEFKAYLGHIYWHVNEAWNARNMGFEYWEASDDFLLHAFPKDVLGEDGYVV